MYVYKRPFFSWFLVCSSFFMEIGNIHINMNVYTNRYKYKYHLRTLCTKMSGQYDNKYPKKKKINFMERGPAACPPADRQQQHYH